MPKFDSLPLFFEELKIRKDSTFSLQNLITQFKQQIPFNYLEIKLEEGNCCGSTNPKWKNKPLSERYFFTYQEREIQLDIPHILMDKLGLEKGADITQPLYLDPQVLTRKETYKGITVQEGEIILVNPNKLVMKEKETQIDLSSDRIKELEETISKQSKQIQEKDKELAELKTKIQELEFTDQELEFLKDIDEFQKLGSSINLDNLPAIWNKVKNTSLGGTDKLKSTFLALNYQMNKLEIMHRDLSNLILLGSNLNVYDVDEITFESKRNNILTLLKKGHLPNKISNIFATASNLLLYYKKEKFWWDKWMRSPSLASSETNKLIPYLKQDLANHNLTEYTIRLEKGIITNEAASARSVVKSIYQYYRDK